MNKIKSLFKANPIAMVMASLLIAGVASAATVSYMSNAPTAALTVSAPVEMSICEGETATGCAGTAITTMSATGLSDVKFTTVAKNNANKSVSGYRVLVVEAPAAEILTGKEFTEVKFRDANNPTPFDMIDMLYVVRGDGTITKLSNIAAGNPTWTNKKMILLFSQNGGINEYALTAGENNWNKFQVTLGNIVGTYNVSAQYVNDLAGYAAETYK